VTEGQVMKRDYEKNEKNEIKEMIEIFCLFRLFRNRYHGFRRGLVGRLVPLLDLPLPVSGTGALPALGLVVPPVALGAAAPVPSSDFAGTGGPSMVGSASKLLR